MARSRSEQARTTAGNGARRSPGGHRSRRDPGRAARGRSLLSGHIRVKAFGFANVAETFIADKLAQERRGKSAPNAICARSSLRHGGDRPIEAKSPSSTCWRASTPASSAPHMARALFIIVGRVLQLGDRPTGPSGLTTSPCDRLKRRQRSSVATPSRTRRLSDDELIAFRRERATKHPAGLVHIGCSCLPACGSARPRVCRGPRFTATLRSSRRRG